MTTKQFETGELGGDILEIFDDYFRRFESEFCDDYYRWKLDCYVGGEMESVEIGTFPEAEDIIYALIRKHTKTDRYFIVSDARIGKKQRPVIAFVFNEDDEYYDIDFFPPKRQENKEKK